MSAYRDDSNLGAIIGALERRIQRLETGNRARQTSISEGGVNLLNADGTVAVGIGSDPTTSEPGVQINGGGSLTVVDPLTGNFVVKIGRLSTANDPDGENYGLALFGPDLEDGTPGAAVMYFYRDNLVLADNHAHVLFAADGVTGEGLAVPHIPYVSGTDSNTSRWPSTTSADWTGVWWGFIERINPYLSWNTYLYVPAGVTAEFRITYGDSVVLGSTSASGGPTGQFVQWSARALVTDVVDYLVNGFLAVEARITAGTGEAKFAWLQLRGDQS